jgi:hypothetical protein
MAVIHTDYLVVGAGLTGTGFVDSLIRDSDAEVVLVDRRHQPGGHWNDAYPFVRLHMPSANYGVDSRALGGDTIDEHGPNAGLYERATGFEIRDYFRRVLEEHLLASGQVRFLGLHDYHGPDTDGHRLISRLTGETTTVRVRRRLVDATYLESAIPSSHTPTFGVDPDARVVPPAGLVDLAEPATGFTVMGAGKTAMDTCQWLLDEGVEPDRIRWIRPRDPWILDRAYYQPLDQVAMFVEGQARQMEAAAQAESLDDLFRRLEDSGQLVRLDVTVEPTMIHTPSLSQAELTDLRSIANVVRRGRVVRVGSGEIVLEDGSIPTDGGQVHVDCTASGLRLAPSCPIFEPGWITMQQVRQNQPAINAALIGHLEATRDDDVEKNRLCEPNPYMDRPADWVRWTLMGLRSEARWRADEELSTWVEASRLNLARGIGDHAHEPLMQSALTRLLEHVEPAEANLERRLLQPVGVPAA